MAPDERMPIPDMNTKFVRDEALELLAKDLSWLHPTMLGGWPKQGIEVVWERSSRSNLVELDRLNRCITVAAGAASALQLTVRQVRSLLYMAMSDALQPQRETRRRRRLRRVVPDPAPEQRSLFHA